MSDVFSKAKRSEVMSRIRSHGNKETELALIRIFRRERISGWRRHRDLIGKPDFVFERQRVAVFVDGCFWHLCSRCGNLPKSNAEFWKTKLQGNVRRDRVVSHRLRSDGWFVLRIWEHELRMPNKAATRVRAALTRGIDGNIE
jgi:DNA mismatch endonuclease, patch repair protein